MCRSGNEGAGVKTRRCNGGLIHEAFLAKRRADYAARKQADNQTLLKPSVTADPEVLTEVKWLLSDDSLFEDDYVYTSERLSVVGSWESQDVLLARNAIQNHSSSLTSTEVESEDEGFLEDNKSSNMVARLILEDGRAGYFKPFARSTSKKYSANTIPTMVNEVAAYQLTQALGENWNNLIPETVIRQYEGELGSFQEEVYGLNYSDYQKATGAMYDLPSEFLGPEQAQRVAVFETLILSQDRHGENYLIENTDAGTQIRLIDNGYSFPSQRAAFINHSQLTDEYSVDRDVPIRPDILNDLKTLQSDPASGGLDQLISAESYACFRERLDYLVDKGVVVSAAHLTNKFDRDR